MTDRRQFAWVLFGAVALASVATHELVRVARVDDSPYWPEHYGAVLSARPMVALGSSLFEQGIDWKVVSERTGRPIELLALSAGSPCEMETLQATGPASDFTLVEVSLTGLNEDQLSDLRAYWVSPWRTWRDLQETQTDAQLSQRIFDCYPLRYERVLFPTAGRSIAVLAGLRDEWQHALKPQADPKARRMADWDKSREMRRVANLRLACDGKMSFAGPKHAALRRMIKRAAAQGGVAVVVLPESPLLMDNLADAGVRREFESSLDDLAQTVPSIKWVRLDRVPELQSDEMFVDAVHLNKWGKSAATEALLKSSQTFLRSR